jgi:hypothetical protein
VENWQDELNVTEVAGTIRQCETASRTSIALIADTKMLIERTVGHYIVFWRI